MDTVDIAHLDPFRLPGRDTFVPTVDYWTSICPLEADWSELVAN